MPSPDDYNFTHAVGVAVASVGEARWEMAKRLAEALENDPDSPWVVRGSSRTGTDGTAFSATPDGVDHWAGRTVGQVYSGANRIWKVLQNSLTGHQLCIFVGPDNGASNSLTLVYALQKFETGGAWRAGGAGATARPVDNTSGPNVEERECSTSGTANATAGTGNSLYVGTTAAATYEFHYAVRKDGFGFFSWMWPDDDDVAKSHAGWVGPASSFPVNDLNPFLVAVANATQIDSVSAGSSTFKATVAGRQIGLTTYRRYNPLTWITQVGIAAYWKGQAANADPFAGWFPIFPSPLLDVASPRTFRRPMQDWFYVDATLPNMETWQGMALIKVGSLLFPWDGTARGTDRLGFFPLTAGAETTPAGTIDPDPKRFDRGMEKV